MKLDKLRTMISKWVLEDRLEDKEIGHKIRRHYWKEIHSYEHWIWEDDEAEMSGYGYDDASRGYNDDGGDEIY